MHIFDVYVIHITIIVYLDGMRPYIQQHKESYDPNHIRDYIDAFISEQKLGKDPGFSVSFVILYLRSCFCSKF